MATTNNQHSPAEHTDPSKLNELKRLVLEDLNRRLRFSPETPVLEIVSDEGQFASILSRLGARVSACSKAEKHQRIRGCALSMNATDNLELFDYDDLTQPDSLPSGPFEIVVCEQVIHTLPYEQAYESVRNLLGRLRIGGKLFVSTFGLYSQLGDQYPDANVPIKSRFSPLNPVAAKLYDLPEKICLYTERDLLSLVFQAGGSVLRTSTMTHGTVCTVAVKV